MNKTLAALTSAAGMLAAGLALLMAPAPAFAIATTNGHGNTMPSSYTSQVISSPDDTVGSGPWARDTFKRTTTVTKAGDDLKVTIADEGSFLTPAGVKGVLDGQGIWVISGGTKAQVAMPGTIDRSGVALKDSFTGQWYTHFVTGGEVKSFTWNWSYRSTCWDSAYVQLRTESSALGESGERPSKVCPAHPSPSPSVSHSPSPSPSVSHSVSPSPSRSTVVAGPVNADGPKPGELAFTGPPVGVMIASGAAILLFGTALVIMIRRRRVSFEA